MTDAECATRRSECRKDVFGALHGKLGLWAAGVVIAIACAVIGTCFTLTLYARSETSDVVKTAAVQARDIQYLAAKLDRIEGKVDMLLEK